MNWRITVCACCPSRWPLPAHPRSLKRCLQNIVDNAIRCGGATRVQVRDEVGQRTIEVRDDGPDIPAPLLERALEPFYRVETSRNTATGGFGLGLSIAHTVALAHHGQLMLRNGDEGGWSPRWCCRAAACNGASTACRRRAWRQTGRWRPRQDCCTSRTITSSKALANAMQCAPSASISITWQA